MNGPDASAAPNIKRSAVDGARLLISVRNAPEAVAALAGGCHILDIKEPSRGSLGMADVVAISAIVREAREIHSDVTISAALGEVVDWSDMPPPAIPTGIALAKLGTAGLGGDLEWRARWSEIRADFSTSATEKLAWVAVAYADAEAAVAPTIDDIVMAAVEEECAGVLVDTYTKSGRSLFDWISPDELKRLAVRVQSAGLFFVLAGQLRTTDLAQVAEVAPDIVAVRSAVCVAGDRENGITPEAVVHFRKSLEKAFQDHSAVGEASGSAAINSK